MLKIYEDIYKGYSISGYEYDNGYKQFSLHLTRKIMVSEPLFDFEIDHCPTICKLGCKLQDLDIDSRHDTLDGVKAWVDSHLDEIAQAYKACDAIGIFTWTDKKDIPIKYRQEIADTLERYDYDTRYKVE